jgi:hypothetical protein
MYVDGYVLWHINSLTENDWFKGNYTRKAVTVSDSDKTKSSCVLIKFESALVTHKKSITDSKIKKTTIDELKKEFGLIEDEEYNSVINKKNHNSYDY